MNLGGNGISIPPNIWLWWGAFVFVLLALWDVVRLKILKTHRWFFMFAGLCAVLFITGSLQVHWTNTNSWLPTLMAMIILFGFIWALVQQEWHQKQLNQLVFSIVLVGGIQALISLVQVFDDSKIFYLLTGYVPFKLSNVPLGSLQQVNMLSSFMAICVVMSVWLFVVIQYSIKQRILLWVLAVLSLYVVLLSGSRAGLIAVVLSLLFLSVAIYKIQFLLKNQPFQERVSRFDSLDNTIGFSKYIRLLLSVLLFAGTLYYFFPGADAGLERVSLKLYDVWLGTDLRLYLYQLSWQTFLHSQWIGYGLDNYPEALMQWVDQVGQSPKFSHIDLSSFQHPHNEILFWLVQTGLLGGIAIFSVMAWVIGQWFKLTSARFWFLIAFIFPLAFQAQLSFPFRLSALHLLLFILFTTLGLLWAKEAKSINFKLKTTPLILIKFSALLIGVSALLFALWTSRSVSEVYYFENRLFLYQNEDWKSYEKLYFAYASLHPFYKQDIDVTMKNMFEIAKIKNNQYDADKYLEWERYTHNSNLSY